MQLLSSSPSQRQALGLSASFEALDLLPCPYLPASYQLSQGPVGCPSLARVLVGSPRCYREHRFEIDVEEHSIAASVRQENKRAEACIN